MNIVDVLEHLYKERGAVRYEIKGRGGVTQMQHALQCAALAVQAESADALVAAALLHDLGHLLHEQVVDEVDEEMGVGNDDLHQFKVLPFLRPYFGPAVLEPIRLHVDAKRYLCATEPGYRAALSTGSQRSLELQGGPFDAAAARAFIARPFAVDAVQLRRWDDGAKDTARVAPPFSSHRERLLRMVKPI